MTQTAEFAVQLNQIAVVGASGLVGEEQLQVEFMVSSDCITNTWAIYSPCGNAIRIDKYYNPISITTPGYYRVSPVGIIDSGTSVNYEVHGGRG